MSTVFIENRRKENSVCYYQVNLGGEESFFFFDCVGV